MITFSRGDKVIEQLSLRVCIPKPGPQRRLLTARGSFRNAGAAEHGASATGELRVCSMTAWASAEGVWRPTIAGASWMSSSFPSASTMKRAKSIAAGAIAREDRVADVPAPDG